ncbi:TetR/AcrR family transcriptional regulator C-terminal domain-containing protein [Pseudonocardia sp. TRM90224]|uniref:TetR/AcrR family transcriptional regulator C-terminal domain-containing protein n=1 Tax=Pseudonocardia sp. TRM90224 TaxID=2812678 RepID=UPI001E37E169|nr:TetR/AcrR family transcriptional regulator C-terminal domain-containing protein [Pseudonocardia sp. TRM90224]
MPGPVDLASITTAAVELLDEGGLPAVSTRKLATKLGISSPSLYWHVRDKAALLDLVAEAICADAFTVDPGLGWRDQLAEGLRQFRTMLLAHRDAAELLRQRPPTGPHRLRHIETTLRILFDAGFTDDEAAGIVRLLTAHVLNSVDTRPAPEPDEDRRAAMREAMATYPNLRRVGPALVRQTGGELFELGLGVILDGLVARAAAKG